jgi:hypothetical protein
MAAGCDKPVTLTNYCKLSFPYSLTAELANMIDNPEEIVSFLAISLPTQSSYFIQIMFVFTFLMHGMELLRVIPLSYALVRRFVG